MDERLSRSNRLPGSEKLTRPEEIGQLSKYLKSIKEVYEESTRLEDQVLGVSGYSTGKIPKIDKLGKKTVRTPDNQGERADLSEKILGIPGKKTEDRLENKRLKLGDTKTHKLDDEKVKAPDNQGGKVSRLEEVVKKIKDIRDQSLADKKLNLLDERNLALEDTRLDLQAMINTSLENKRINLEDKQEIELVEKKVRLEDENIPELSDTRLNLKDTRETTLDNKILGVEGETKEIELGDKRLDIQDVKIQSLETKRIKLSAEEEIELGNKKLEIKDSGNIELEDKRLEIWDDRNLDLPDTKLKLEDSRETELRDKKVKLEDTRTIRLENKKAELGDDRENRLEEKRVDLDGVEEIELEEKKIELVDENVTSLSDKLLWLTDERDTELEDKLLKVEDGREIGLEGKRVDIEGTGEIELENKRVELGDDREIRLEGKRIEIENKQIASLSDKLLSLLDNREPELSEKKIVLENLREIGLREKKVELKNEQKIILSDKVLSILDDRKPELENKKIKLEDSQKVELENEKIQVLENTNGEPIELYDEFLGIPENENGEPVELYSQFLGVEENKNSIKDNLSDKILKVEENKNSIKDNLSDKILKVEENHGTGPNIFNAESLREYTASLSDSELYEFAMSLVSEGNNGSGDAGGWLEKVGSLMSAYLSSDILTPKRAIEFRDAINNTLEASYFGSQAALRVPVDTSSGTIWAKAEEAIGEQLTGTNRRDALDEMIVKMVDYKKSNLPSLPGSDLIDATKGALKNVVGIATGSNNHPNPMNKPLHLNGSALPGGYGDTLYQAANNRTSYDSIDPVGDTIGTIFYDRYWNSRSFKTTLEDLCPIIGKAPVASLAELKALLKASPYITTPGKFMTDTKGSYNTQTLDTNMYWEVVLEPFCMSKGNCSNGGFSYLPSIQEINFENEFYHKVKTRYGFWAPINGFELQKSKLITKSLPLYEGEIVYPTGMEFTNELRLTFIDDSWKSWRRYFEKCAQVAVFNSTPHTSTFYQLPALSFINLTSIDKDNVCVASYKNLAFNIRIYILSPQLNTIKKYDLLCVLKDFSEEYVGEIDSGGTDLNVTFSIVGESPKKNDATNFALLSKEITASTIKQVALDTQKRVTNTINSSIGLL